MAAQTGACYRGSRHFESFGLNLDQVRRTWDTLVELDPISAILYDSTAPVRWTMDEFMASGTREIDSLIAFVRHLPLQLSCRRALDFGCGLGRLTQALGGHFDEVVGVDLSESMVTRASHLNLLGDRCTYRVNDSPDLRAFESGSFDLVHSTRTLQLLPGRYVRTYLREFVRLLDHGGVLVVQVPSHPVSATVRARVLAERYGNRAAGLGRALLGRPAWPLIETHGVGFNDVYRLLAEDGVPPVAILPDRRGGRDWVSFRYVCQKGIEWRDPLAPPD